MNLFTVLFVIVVFFHAMAFIAKKQKRQKALTFKKHGKALSDNKIPSKWGYVRQEKSPKRPSELKSLDDFFGFAMSLPKTDKGHMQKDMFAEKILPLWEGSINPNPTHEGYGRVSVEFFGDYGNFANKRPGRYDLFVLRLDGGKKAVAVPCRLFGNINLDFVPFSGMRSDWEAQKS